MHRKSHTVKINLPGGIVAAGELHALMSAALDARVEQVKVGNRQQLYLRVEHKYLPVLSAGLQALEIPFEINGEEYPNIISSYVTEEVFQNGHWLSEGVYKDILDGFDYRPRLKINLVDSSQTFVPWFTGHINFIASPVGNYWYLYIRIPKAGDLYCWKGLIYSDDIPRISRLVEAELAAFRLSSGGQRVMTGEGLQERVYSREHFVTQPVTTPLSLPAFALPYYEGFNRYANKSWLGIYRRQEEFPVAFLKDLARICLQTKVGQLYTTPWKSIIIKGIEQTHRKYWDYVLGKYRINVRHASNELNWQIEDGSEEGLGLKRYLIRQFDKEDLRTYGLCFAVKTKRQSGLFGSVIIRRRPNPFPNQRKSLDRYDILYTRDFNPNSREYILFRDNLEKENLGTYLVSLCKYFYECQSGEDMLGQPVYLPEPAPAAPDAEAGLLYRCGHCLTVYDPQYGDPAGEIPAGTPFEQVGDAFCCPTCEAPKSDFGPVEKTAPVLIGK